MVWALWLNGGESNTSSSLGFDDFFITSQLPASSQYDCPVVFFSYLSCLFMKMPKSVPIVRIRFTLTEILFAHF